MISSFEISKLIVSKSPDAYARIKGNNGVDGFFYAYKYKQGSIVVIEMHGLVNRYQDGELSKYRASITSRNSKKLSSIHKDSLNMVSFNQEAWISVYTANYIESDSSDNYAVIIHEYFESNQINNTNNKENIVAYGEIISLDKDE